MDKEISIYDIDITLRDKKVYYKFKKLIGKVPYMSFEDLEQYIIGNDELYNKLEINTTYFLIIEEPWKIYGVIDLHKGWTFIDVAEHDERTIIKTAFSNQKCQVIGEN